MSTPVLLADTSTAAKSVTANTNNSNNIPSTVPGQMSGRGYQGNSSALLGNKRTDVTDSTRHHRPQ